MNRYICVHGHFYQPPRENPWSGVIEQQRSAAPFHDWNQRIASECYAPNAQTQILNNTNHAIRTVNNYAQISFNFGPTLLSWMERQAPQAYQAILEADRISMERFSGHGSAVAQAYNHMIMPLANPRDKQTQVIWGIKDFEYRFGRKPEGMWLPETAVDIKTLEVLAQHGIVFTILSPGQAKKVKKINERKWVDVSEGTIDTQRPYLCRLPSGKKVNLFYYNGAVSNEVAFGGLLENGVNFANRLVNEYPESQQKNRLAHIANDGESYGHHHAFGNMALAYMLHYIESNQLAKITIYGEFLANNPPEDEVQIKEDTSWSCYHGVERWKSHCGCRLDAKAQTTQEWRKCLRETLDWLRDGLVPLYEDIMASFCRDPWEARNSYIDLLLNLSPENKGRFFKDACKSTLTDNDKVKIISLLEMQRYAMLMYTSCGWFFDDISGIEALQVLQYAARALQLAKEAGGADFEGEFLERLNAAKSNNAEMKNGKDIYNTYIKQAMKAQPAGK
jgi:alpha-amylase/alpha-mannosidase (GH57 family)